MQDDLRWNKIFGAILATALAIVVLRQASDMIFAPGEPPHKPGYAISVQEAAGGGEGEAADVMPDWGTVLPAADVAAGEVISTKCASCHSFASGGPNLTGPDLWAVVGRKPGSHAGFAYSPAMSGESSKVATWDYAHLYEFLKSPQGYVPGTKMSFVGLKKPEDRINLIAWLRTKSDSPAPIPAPKPAAAAPAAAEAAPAEGAAATEAKPEAGAAAKPEAAAAPEAAKAAH
jgi:cytochrome c